MNRIEKLIEELCPDGVEFRELGMVCKVLRGKRLTKKELSDNAKYPVYHGGIIPLGFYNEYNCKANSTMVINTGSVGEVGYSYVDFWSSDGTFTIQTPDNIDDRYVYLYLKIKENFLKSQRREGGVPTINRETVEKVVIPIPPLPIQQEIVSILDTFTALDASLQAELEARRKQYEHYRDQLLSFEGKEVEWKVLGDVCDIYDGTHQTPKYTNEGVRFVSVENIKSLYDTKKFISRVDYDNLYKIKPQLNDVFMTRIGSIGACAIVDRNEELAYYVTLTLLRPNQQIVQSKYVRFYIESSNGQSELRKRTLINAVPIKINLGEIGKIKIPIPPLPIQHRIVSILDKFDALVNTELPDEIAARRKQYEYYREKLLTFKPLKS